MPLGRFLKSPPRRQSLPGPDRGHPGGGNRQLTSSDDFLDPESAAPPSGTRFSEDEPVILSRATTEDHDAVFTVVIIGPDGETLEHEVAVPGGSRRGFPRSAASAPADAKSVEGWKESAGPIRVGDRPRRGSERQLSRILPGFDVSQLPHPRSPRTPARSPCGFSADPHPDCRCRRAFAAFHHRSSGPPPLRRSRRRPLPDPLRPLDQIRLQLARSDQGHPAQGLHAHHLRPSRPPSAIRPAWPRPTSCSSIPPSGRFP